MLPGRFNFVEPDKSPPRKNLWLAPGIMLAIVGLIAVMVQFIDPGWFRH